MKVLFALIFYVCSLTFSCYCDVKLFVAISAGLPRSQRHIREIAVHFTNLNVSLVNEGILIVARDADFQSVLSRYNLYDNIDDDEDPTAGRIFTGYTIPKTNFSSTGVSSAKCLGYFVRLEWRKQIMASSCLRVYPNWMSDLLNQDRSFGNLTLNNLAVPGTHNAGAYKIYDPPEESTFTWYRDCQEEDIYTQLMYGSRFIDIRPGMISINDTRKFWVFHSVFRTDNLLEVVLKDIRRFLDENKNEIVFVDFHEFPWGFKKSSDYGALGDFVESILGPYMLQYRPHMITVAETISLDQRAVVTFERDESLARRFLPGISHVWANTDNLDMLKRRLKMMQIQKHEGNRLFSAMAQQTPQGGLSIFFDTYEGGVRGISHRSNWKVMSWWRNEPSFRQTTNIVAVDYLTSTDIVDICRDINMERAAHLASRKNY